MKNKKYEEIETNFVAHILGLAGVMSFKFGMLTPLPGGCP